MTVDTCISKAKQYINIDIRLIPCKIGEAYKKHISGIPLTDEDKFFLGLRYSEFFAEGGTNEDYYQASIKRDAILRVMHIDFTWLMQSCITICGLH